MHAQKIEDAVLDLLWSAWTELGVRGSERRHRMVAVDPDALIVWTPVLAAADPRLLEQVTAWCEQHGESVSKTRLDGLQHLAPHDASSAFATFLGSLGGAAARWRSVKDPGKRTAGTRRLPLPLERPSLARLRMRALAGTGARADVLCELLGSTGRWLSATDLERLGYTRRNVARVLNELTAGQLTSERSGRGVAAFQLREPQALARLVAGESLTWPDWTSVLTLAWHLVELERSIQRAVAVAPVSARDAWDQLRRLSLASGLREPPPATGETAWVALLDWGSSALRRWPCEPAGVQSALG